ncbi:hypothetical protein QAD02_003338 [Eretmocerus hayati]|uniref:Uncharacterized protein n=1 Tax=Eretmocerus hayati TaxID=131215 RepID=A0ACC2NP31_9HYME|nr:hypothetical protein QAD02_003338 [Eretmocerus hayati]
MVSRISCNSQPEIHIGYFRKLAKISLISYHHEDGKSAGAPTGGNKTTNLLYLCIYLFSDLEESQFFELSIIEISTRLPDDNEGEVIEFMTKLHVAKSNSMKIVEQVVEEMEVDGNDEDLSDHQNDQMVQPGDSVPEPDASTGSGVHDDIIALLLISLSPRVPKKIKVGSGGSVKIRTLTREEISQSFILRVQIASERAKAQEKFELWLEALGIAKYPYITFVGKLPEVVAYVTFNGGNYHYPEPLKAVEACYKFLNALHIFPPSIPEFAWSVIDLLVYRFTWKTKINANICNFVRDIDPTLATEET